MRTAIAVLAIWALLCGDVLAGETPEKPAPPADPAEAEAIEKFLGEAGSAWYSASRDGMKSVVATAKLDTEGEGIFGDRGGKFNPRKPKLSGLEIDWAWSEGAGEEIRIPKIGGGRTGGLQKVIQKRIDGLWRGIAGMPYGPLPEGLDAALSDAGTEKEVKFTKNKKPVLTLRFDATTKLPTLQEAYQGKRTVATRFRFEKVGEKLVLKGLQRSTEIDNQIKDQTNFSWDNFREVNKRPLPMVGKIEFGGNSITLRFTYGMVNGAPAKVKEVKKEEVMDLAKLLSNAFRSNSIVEKQEAIRAAMDAGTDHAAQLLAKYIYDKDVGVEVVKTLGKMGKKSATSALISAFGKTSKRVELHETVIWALGEIGDPRAVRTLSKNLWGRAGTETWRRIARLRIQAMGKIRHTSAVDELVGMSDDSRRKWHAGLRKEVYASLRALTGQSFRSSREWKDWWKKNRSTFRF